MSKCVVGFLPAVVAVNLALTEPSWMLTTCSRLSRPKRPFLDTSTRPVGATMKSDKRFADGLKFHRDTIAHPFVSVDRIWVTRMWSWKIGTTVNRSARHWNRQTCSEDWIPYAITVLGSSSTLMYNMYRPSSEKTWTRTLFETRQALGHCEGSTIWFRPSSRWMPTKRGTPRKETLWRTCSWRAWRCSVPPRCLRRSKRCLGRSLRISLRPCRTRRRKIRAGCSTVTPSAPHWQKPPFAVIFRTCQNWETFEKFQWRRSEGLSRNCWYVWSRRDWSERGGSRRTPISVWKHTRCSSLDRWTFELPVCESRAGSWYPRLEWTCSWWNWLRWGCPKRRCWAIEPCEGPSCGPDCPWSGSTCAGNLLFRPTRTDRYQWTWNEICTAASSYWIPFLSFPSIRIVPSSRTKWWDRPGWCSAVGSEDWTVRSRSRPLPSRSPRAVLRDPRARASSGNQTSASLYRTSCFSGWCRTPGKDNSTNTRRTLGSNRDWTPTRSVDSSPERKRVAIRTWSRTAS